MDFIRGHGDREIGALAAGASPDDMTEPYRVAMAWVAARLDAGHRWRVEAWAESIRVHVEGPGEVLLCHAAPSSDREIVTRLTSEDHVRLFFEDAGAPLVGCGHTQMQFDPVIGGVRVVNAGSVGMPLGGPGACRALLGAGVELRRTPYDHADAARRVRGTGCPDAYTFAERHVLHPPSEAEMLEVFGGAKRT